MEYLSLGTLIEQAKGTTLVALSARFRFRNKAMQPALCPKLLPWSGIAAPRRPLSSPARVTDRQASGLGGQWPRCLQLALVIPPKEGDRGLLSVALAKDPRNGDSVAESSGASLWSQH